MYTNLTFPLIQALANAWPPKHWLEIKNVHGFVSYLFSLANSINSPNELLPDEKLAYYTLLSAGLPPTIIIQSNITNETAKLISSYLIGLKDGLQLRRNTLW